MREELQLPCFVNLALLARILGAQWLLGILQHGRKNTYFVQLLLFTKVEN